MIRIIGILCGSAFAISLLIVVVGIPRISPGEPTPVENDVAAPEPLSSEPVSPEPEVVPVTTQPEVVPPPSVSEAPAADNALVETSVEPVAEPVAQPFEEPVHADNWYAFWSPFRSELAANGFVSQLQRTTGLDYRVVKVKTGVYEVAFAYADDADIETKLAAIESATGLEMPGG